jgi:hypothetical protein
VKIANHGRHCLKFTLSGIAQSACSTYVPDITGAKCDVYFFKNDTYKVGLILVRYEHQTKTPVSSTILHGFTKKAT